MLVCMIIIVYLQYGVVLFNDDFNRTEGSAVGNSWTNIGPVSPIIENSCMKVISNSLQGVRRDFTSLGITSGIYYVSFDWKITSNNWLADAFPNGTVTYLRHDYEGNLYYDNTSDFSNPITIGSLALNTWANFKLKVNIDTDRFSLWINNTLVADNIAGLSVTDFTRFTFRAGSGSTVTQYIDNFIVYNDTPPATPTNLTATGAVNDISLSWTGSPQDFLTYKVYRKTTSPADVFLAEVPGTQTNYIDVTAAANTDYFYRVKAVSMSTIESNFSNESTAHMQPDISVTPQIINVTVGQGYTGETSFTIENNGNYPLNWNIAGIVPIDGLVGFYPFNGNANDQSGFNNNGVVYNATLTTDRFGTNQSAYYFDGSGDYIFFPNMFQFHITGDATISFWMKKNDTAKRTILWSRANSPDTNRYQFYTGETGQGFELDYRTPSGTLKMNTMSHDFTVPLQEWANIIVKRTGNQYHLYRNGVFMKTETDTSPYLPTSIGWMIGSSLSTQAGEFYGSLDDISIYNRSLSDSEMNILYQSPISSYISINPSYGNVPSLQQTQIILNANAQNLSAGVYTDTLYVNSNDPNTPSIPILVNLIVAPGDIVVNPTQVTVELNTGASVSNKTFNVNNTGLGKLVYYMRGTDDYNTINPLPTISGFSPIGQFNGSRYYQSTSVMNWTSANSLCAQVGGHLVTISSPEENNYVFQNSTGLRWIGLTCDQNSTQWHWVNYEPVLYTNWYPGEPNGSSQAQANYAQMNWGAHGSQWTDIYNNELPAFAILEISTSILSCAPANAIVGYSAVQGVSMNVNGSTLSDGLYNTSVMVLSNAPEPRDTLYIPVTVKVDYTPPTTPFGLTFDEIQSDMNQIYLSWTANALADSVHSYKVFRRGLHDTLWSLKGTVDADHNWFIDDQFTGLDTTAVYYKLTAVDWVDNESAASDEVMAWLQRFPAPTGLTMEIIRDRHVQLTWNPVTQTISGNPGTPSCYVIYRSNTPSPIEDFYFVGAVDATTFTHNWAAWFIEIGKQFYVVTAYSGNFEDLRAVAESRSEWKYGELERAAFDYLTNIKRTK